MKRPGVLACGLCGGLLLLIGCGRNERAAAVSDEPLAKSTPASETDTAGLSGEEIYTQYCAVCHMADGSGVPNFQPALVGNPIVTGDPAKLEAVIRAGSAALADREARYAAEMPPFGNLSDAEVKAIVAYTRERFGGNSTPPARATP